MDLFPIINAMDHDLNGMRYPLYQYHPDGTITRVPEPLPPDLDDQLREILQAHNSADDPLSYRISTVRAIQRIRTLFGEPEPPVLPPDLRP